MKYFGILRGAKDSAPKHVSCAAVGITAYNFI